MTVVNFDAETKFYGLQDRKLLKNNMICIYMKYGNEWKEDIYAESKISGAGAS